MKRHLPTGTVLELRSATPRGWAQLRLDDSVILRVKWSGASREAPVTLEDGTRFASARAFLNFCYDLVRDAEDHALEGTRDE